MKTRRALAILLCCAALLADAASSAAAQSSPLVVGPGCSYSRLSTAIRQAALIPGPNIIHVVQGSADGDQALEITGQDLTIKGGHTSCSDVDVGLDRTVISGFGGRAASVFTIRGPGVVRLENLAIIHGDTATFGGGINYRGDAVTGQNKLVLTRTNLDSNVAGQSGGGISFTSGGDQLAELVLEEDTGVFRNHAVEDGGGVHLTGNTYLRAEGHRLFFWSNKAERNGGALFVHQPALVDIGSASWIGTATFQFNKALEGGSIYIEAPYSGQGSMPTVMRLYSIRGDQPMRFQNEVDVNDRGASSGSVIRVNSPVSTDPRPAVLLCTQNVNFFRNQTARAAGQDPTRLGLISLSGTHFGHCPDDTPFPASAVTHCTPRSLCNVFESNSVAGQIGALRHQSLFSAAHSTIHLRSARIVENSSPSHLFQLTSGGARPTRLLIENSEITGNRLGITSTDPRHLVDASSPSVEVQIVQSTLANNSPSRNQPMFRFGNGPVNGSPLAISNSILSEDFEHSLSGGIPPSSVVLEHVLLQGFTSEHDHKPGVIVGDPLFESEIFDNYRLLPSSPALDLAPQRGDFLSVDLDGGARPRDLQRVANGSGPVDLGAYEVQTEPPAPPTTRLLSDGFESPIIAPSTPLK